MYEIHVHKPTISCPSLVKSAQTWHWLHADELNFPAKKVFFINVERI